MVGYTCDNNLFFFLKDAEGDVIGLVDSSNGNVVEKYSYDPWGAVTGANANSQRFNSIYYRGYYYDIDDSRYYLQSRYYKHQWGSFINADLPQIAQQTKNEVNGLNLFTYCNNDPVNNEDQSGYSVVLSTLAIAGIIATCLLLVGVTLSVYFLVNSTDFKPAINTISNLNRNYGMTKKAILAFLKTSIKATFNYAKAYIITLYKIASAAIVIACANKKIESKVKKNSKQRYWIASLKKIYGAPYIELGPSVSFSLAVDEINSKRHIFTVTKKEGRILTNRCGKIYVYHSNNQHNGYFPHFHPKNSKKSHIWFMF